MPLYSNPSQVCFEFNLSIWKESFFFHPREVEKQITGHPCPYNGKNHEIVSCFEGVLLTEAEENEFIALFLSWLHIELDESIVWFTQFTYYLRQ